MKTIQNLKSFLKYLIACLEEVRLYFKYYFTRHSDIKICISTTKGYADKTIPALIKSLVENKVKLDNIYVFEGGYYCNKKKDNVEYNHYKVDHNSFDLTALISIINLQIKKKYWLLLHDTVEVDNSFRYKFFTLKPYKFECMPLNIFPSMNIGIYSNDLIEKHSTFILKQKNSIYNEEVLQEFKKKAVLNEDYIFLQCSKKGYINPKLRFFSSSKIIEYNNKNRLLEYHAPLGILKYKANFQQMENYSILL